MNGLDLMKGRRLGPKNGDILLPLAQSASSLSHTLIFGETNVQKGTHFVAIQISFIVLYD